MADCISKMNDGMCGKRHRLWAVMDERSGMLARFIFRAWRDAGAVQSFRALPDLRPWISNPSLGERIAFHLEDELEGLLNELGGALVGVFDGFDILASVECVGSTVMVNGDAGLWVGLCDSPVPAGEEFEPAARRLSLPDLARLADQNPGSNQIFPELRRRSSSGFIRRMKDDEHR